MAWLRYYARERESVKASFPELLESCEFEDAKTLIKRLAEEHGVEVRGVEPARSGAAWHSSRKVIRFRPGMPWRTVIHEFAHAMDFKLHPSHKKHHTSTLLDLVLDLCQAVYTRGWHRSIPEERKAREAKAADCEAARAVREAAISAPAAVRARKIERRRAQIVRLERRIKTLTTRLKTARRSLAALERAASKGGES